MDAMKLEGKLYSDPAVAAVVDAMAKDHLVVVGSDYRLTGAVLSRRDHAEDPSAHMTLHITASEAQAKEPFSGRSGPYTYCMSREDYGTALSEWKGTIRETYVAKWREAAASELTDLAERWRNELSDLYGQAEQHAAITVAELMRFEADDAGEVAVQT